MFISYTIYRLKSLPFGPSILLPVLLFHYFVRFETGLKSIYTTLAGKGLYTIFILFYNNVPCQISSITELKQRHWRCFNVATTLCAQWEYVVKATGTVYYGLTEVSAYHTKCVRKGLRLRLRMLSDVHQWR